MDINSEKRNLGLLARRVIEGRLYESLVELGEISRRLGEWQINSSVEKLQDNYNALLRFFAAGSVDGERKNMIDNIVSEALALIMRLSRQISMESGSELYFSTARSLQENERSTIADKVESYRMELQRLENDFDSLTEPNRTLVAEQILRDIFNMIWVSHPLSSEDFEAIDAMMSPLMPFHARASIISAVGLGHFCYYDTKRVVWLLKKYIEYAQTEPELGLRALVDAMTGILRYRRRPLSVQVKNVLNAARDQAFWDKDFTSVAIELMRAVGTKKLSDKVNNEIMSQLGKLDADIREKLQNGELDFESFSSDLNPEWDEKLGQSNLGRNLKEMAEIQAEGGDVFMSSFSQMKRFPFFHELPNWFLPFYDYHFAVASADSDDGLLGSLLSKMPILCDNDKYSLVLSIKNIPSAQLDQLMAALRMQAEQMNESLSEVEKASGEKLRWNYINKYVQNFYRFLNLFRNKSDFYNIFANEGSAPDLLDVTSLAGNPDSDELYETIAEFYFRQRMWAEAARAFGELDKRCPPEPRRSQQLAYAYERSGDLPRAITAYEEAEMLDGNSEWTIRRMAGVLRASGDFIRASSLYKRLSDMHPDDYDLTLACAETMLDAEKFPEAEQAFRKALYISPESIGAMRGLAWTLFLNKKIDKAAEVYDEIISRAPQNEDYERAGIVRWAQGDIREAINLFRMYVQDNANAILALDADLVNYRNALEAAGADLSIQKIIIDALRYLSEQ